MALFLSAKTLLMLNTRWSNKRTIAKFT